MCCDESQPQVTWGDQNYLLETIRGRPSTLSGGQNKLFADRLVDRDSADRTLLRVETREIQGQNESCFVGFSLLCRKNLLGGEKRREMKRNRAQRQVGPITNGNHPPRRLQPQSFKLHLGVINHITVFDQLRSLDPLSRWLQVFSLRNPTLTLISSLEDRFISSIYYFYSLIFY